MEDQQPQQTGIVDDEAERVEALNTGDSEADRVQRRQALERKREEILAEHASTPHPHSALRDALASVEEELAQLGWMLHL